jgi:hypothetical protein
VNLRMISDRSKHVALYNKQNLFVFDNTDLTFEHYCNLQRLWNSDRRVICSNVDVVEISTQNLRGYSK